MPKASSTLLDADDFRAALARLAAQIDRDRLGDAPLALVGVRTRGVPIARRLAELLRGLSGTDAFVGAVEISLYRDDLGRGDRWPVLLGTEIDFRSMGPR